MFTVSVYDENGSVHAIKGFHSRAEAVAWVAVARNRYPTLYSFSPVLEA